MVLYGMQGCKNAPFEAHVVFVLDVNDSLGVSYNQRNVHVGRTVKRRVFVDANVISYNFQYHIL